MGTLTFTLCTCVDYYTNPLGCHFLLCVYLSYKAIFQGKDYFLLVFVFFFILANLPLRNFSRKIIFLCKWTQSFPSRPG